MVPQTSVMFTSKAAVENGTIESYNLKKQVEIVKNCRTVTKHDMKFNNAMPEMEVDPELFVSNAQAFVQISLALRADPNLLNSRLSQLMV